MPTIRKESIHEKQIPYKKNSDGGQEFYSSMAWNRLRKTFLSLHPICSECLKHEKVEPATCIHHKVPFMRGETDEEKWSLFLDENNLIPLCNKCHTALHIKDAKYGLSALDDLSEKEWKYAQGIVDFD